MSIFLVLEIEYGCSLDQIGSALLKVSGVEVEYGNDEIHAYFTTSNTRVTVEKEHADGTCRAEGTEDVGWKVAVRAYFHVDPSNGRSLEDIRSFITAFSELTEARFVLSFQYENLYAVRNNNGLILSDALG